MANDSAARTTGAEVLPHEVDYTVEKKKMVVPMLYPLVVVMTLFGRTANVFWPFNPPVDVGPVVEQPLVVLLRTCLTFFAIVLVHMYTVTAWHLFGILGSVGLRRHHSWLAAVGLWFFSTIFFFHYVNLPGIIGVHPAEKIVAQVSSSVLLIFTIILVVVVPLKGANYKAGRPSGLSG